MKRSHALITLAVLALAAAFGAWSFAQEPPQPPDVPKTTMLIDEDVDIDADVDMDMLGPGGPMMGRCGPAGRGLMGAAMLAGIAEELGLTEQQQTQLRALHFQGAKSGLQTHTNARLRRLELEELLQQDEPDQAELNKHIQALADAQGAALRQRIEHRMAFRRVLTPEQRAKLRTAMRERVHHRMLRFREGGGIRMRGPQVERFERFERREPPRPPEPPDL